MGSLAENSIEFRLNQVLAVSYFDCLTCIFETKTDTYIQIFIGNLLGVVNCLSFVAFMWENRSNSYTHSDTFSWFGGLADLRYARGSL